VRLLLPALCEALSARGVRIAADRKGRCIAAPAERVTPAMFEGLKRYKLEVLRALRSLPESTLAELHFCPRCGSDVVLEVTAYCGTCALLTGRTIEMEPESPAEIAYLNALENSEQLSPTVPNESKSRVGTVGTVGTLKQVIHTHAHASKEKVKSA
jgi:hypothetical protein